MGRVVHKEGFGTTWLEKRGCVQSKQNGDGELKQKLPTTASRDNDIKIDVVVCCRIIEICQGKY